MENKIFNQIKNNLPQPNEAWLKQTKDFVVSRFEATHHPKAARTVRFDAWEKISIFRQLALKPVAIAALLIIIVLGGPLATITAAQKALPGDPFYPIKETVNKAKKLVTLTKNRQVALEMEFMGSSISDFQNVVETRLVEQVPEGDKVQKVKLAIHAVNKDIESIGKKLNAENQPQDTRKLAVLVTKEKHNYQNSLNQTRQKLSSTVQQEVRQNLEDVEDKLAEIHTKSLGILAQAHDEGGEEIMPQTELALLIEEEINTAADKASQLDSGNTEDNLQELIEEQSSVVQDKLENAKELVSEGRLFMALVHVGEANKKIDMVEDIMKKVKEVNQEPEDKQDEDKQDEDNQELAPEGVVEGEQTTDAQVEDQQDQESEMLQEDKEVLDEEEGNSPQNTDTQKLDQDQSQTDQAVDQESQINEVKSIENNTQESLPQEKEPTEPQEFQIQIGE